MKKYFIVPAVKPRFAVIRFLICLYALFFACGASFAGELKICFAGDLLLDRGVRQKINKNGADSLFKNVSGLFAGFDAVVVNLECPVTLRNTPVNKKYIFRAEPQWLASLKRAGITHAALANNHTNDQGRLGVKDTIQHLEGTGIVPFGAGKDAKEAAKPVFIEKNGIKAALLNSVLVPLENWAYLENEYGPCQSSVDELCAKIKELKKADKKLYVIVVLHWGVEYAVEADISQRNGARRLIEAGADAIVGHHPHVIQPVEEYKGKYIFYSLGNFIFDSRNPQANKGFLAELIFSENEITKKERHYEIKQCVPVLRDF